MTTIAQEFLYYNRNTKIPANNGCSSLNNNSEASGAFYPTCQFPFAYQIHRFIKTYFPRPIARLVATIWFAITAAFSCSLCVILNVLFMLCWWPFKLLLPSDYFYFWVELITAIIFGACGRTLLLLNCFIWPIFEYRGPIPSSVDSSVQPPNFSIDLSFHPVDDLPSDVSDDAFSTTASPNSVCDDCSISPSSSEFCNTSDVQREMSHQSIMAGYFPCLNSAKCLVNRRTPCTGSSQSPGCSQDYSKFKSTEFVPRQTIIMSNHLSNADGFLLAGLVFGWPIKIIYKADLHYVPILGQSMITGRQVPIYFNKSKGGWGVTKTAVIVMMERISQLIQSGFPILVFPEGTRRCFNRMSPFRTGLFKFCVDSETEAYPVVLYGPQHSWPTGSMMVDFHEIYVVYAKESIQSRGHTPESLILAVRNSMIQMLKLCPGYNHEIERPIETIEEFKRLQQESPKKLTFF